MSYHYVLNTSTGDQRRIMSSSLPTYQAASGWLVFDREEERAAFVPPQWYTINYATRRRPERVTASQAATYWQATHLRAGWAVFTSEADARAALEVMPLLYAASEYTGEVRAIATWLPEQDRPAMAHSFEGAYADPDAARASLPPPLICFHMAEGYRETCYPSRRANMEADGYIVRATLEECQAAMPVRFAWDGGARRYTRRFGGRLMTRPSAYVMTRAAIRAVANELEVFQRSGRSYNTREILNATAQALHIHHNPDRQGYFSAAYSKEAAQEFCKRLNAILGVQSFSLCGDCQNNWAGPGCCIFEGRLICANCQGNYLTCNHCSCLMHEADARENARGQTVCQAHWQPVVDAVDGVMRSYSTDIMRLKNGFLCGRGEKPDMKKTLWLGWELEVHAKGSEQDGANAWVFDEDCNDCGGDGEYRDGDGDTTGDRCDCGIRHGNKAEAVKHIQEAAGAWCIVKEDSSLNDGLEIVSVPASLSWHRETVAPFLMGAKEYLSGWPHNDCGIHVHVGKKQLSELQLSKLVRFMHGDANQQFLTAVAGRDPNTYCNRGGFKAIGAFKSEGRIGRYQALNFATRNEKTVEFRIFRSNVSPIGFMKNLEFVHAACQWARFTSSANLGHASLVEYVRRERSAYPALVRFFESNGTLPAPKRHPDAPVPAFLVAA